MGKYEELKKFVLDQEADFEKFYEKKNFAAGTRVRQAMQKIKDIAADIRKDVQEIKNASKND